MDGEISAEELEEALESDARPLVVDIRPEAAYERGHIPGSVNVPLSRLPREVDQVADADHVVAVCPHGQASVQAARLITSFEDFGGRVESLAGGLDAWDGPFERSEADAVAEDGAESPDAPF